MKKKQYLTAILPAAVMLAVVLLNVGVQRKASVLYAQAYTAAQQQDYTQARSILFDLEEVAPNFVPQYELSAQVYLKNGTRESARNALQQGILRTGSRRLIQLLDALDEGAQTLDGPLDTQTAAGDTLPSELPETWENETPATDAPASYGSLNYNFVVRYADSDLGNQVQMGPGEDFSTDGVQWTSSNPMVASVDQNGLVTCTSQVGEAKITASNGQNKQAECWVCVLEPDIYLEEQSEGYFGMTPYYYIPEGNFQVGVNENLDEAVEETPHKSTIDLLPHVSVSGDGLGDATAFDYSFSQTQAVVSDLVDENGNPIVITGTDPATPEQAATGNTVQIQMGWESMYFSGEYRIPTQLRCSGTTYQTTGVEVDSSGNYGITKLSVPASVVSLSTEGRNPFSQYVELESFDVDAGNSAYRSQDGVLYSADGTRLIAYPVAASAAEYTIPDSVTTIGADAFAGNENLQKLTIPASVTSIESGALGQMASLKEIDLASGNTAFRLENGVLTDSGGTRLVATVAGQMPETYTVPASITEIDEEVFSNNSGLRSLTVDTSAASLNFTDCANLEELVLNGSVQNLTISDCPKLTHIVVNSPMQTMAIMGTDKGQTARVELNAQLMAFSSQSVPVDVVNLQNVTNTLSILVGDTLPTNFSPDLQVLYIDLNQQENALDLNNLAGCSRLFTLEVSNGTLQNPEVLSRFPDLNTLRFDTVSTSDWKGVWQCTNLRSLSLISCEGLQSISGVENLSNLSYLEIYDAEISDISPLSACQQLTTVTINNCKNLKDTSVLDELPGLMYKNLNNNGDSWSE